LLWRIVLRLPVNHVAAVVLVGVGEVQTDIRVAVVLGF